MAYPANKSSYLEPPFANVTAKYIVDSQTHESQPTFVLSTQRARGVRLSIVTQLRKEKPTCQQIQGDITVRLLDQHYDPG
jgi:hypothetical protein